MTDHCYCTYIDINYLPRLVAMYHSLHRHSGGNVALHVLCHDLQTADALATLRLPGIEIIPIQALEKADPELEAVKASRSRIEYYFTSTPSLMRYVMRHAASGSIVTYLDADLFFFAAPDPLYAEIGDASIVIIPHNHPPAFREYEKAGIYNVGWVSLRCDDNGLRCVEWWRERCLEWCYDRCEENRFADQKYLDRWPSLFKGVHIVRHKGANLAPWNIQNFAIHQAGGKVLVEDQPLLFYHFHHYGLLSPGLVDPGFNVYGGALSPEVIRAIHLPYVRAVLCAQRQCGRWGRGGLGGAGRYDTRQVLVKMSLGYRFRAFLEGRAVSTLMGRPLYIGNGPARRCVDILMRLNDEIRH